MAAVNPELFCNNESDVPITENFGHTKIKVIKCSFTWTIHNFRYWPGKIGEFLTSPRFSADNDKLEWSLRIYPKGQSEGDTFIGLYLKCENANKIKTKVNISIINLKPEANKRVLKEMNLEYSNGETFGFRKFVEQKYKFLPEDNLTIFCEVSVVSDTDYEDMSWRKNHINNIPKNQLTKNFGNFFDNQLLSDVTLSVGDRQFKAHKVILAAQSPVFSAMFSHKMKENDRNLVNIDDVDEQVFEEMLQFMYTEKVPNLAKMAKKLLSVAEKYLIENLKIMCENELCHNVTIESAAETLILADLFSANQLKTHTIQFIKNHLMEVGDTLGFNNMIATHPILAAEILKAATKRTNTDAQKSNKRIKIGE